MVFSMCPSTPQSVSSAVYNLMISVGSLLSLCILSLGAYQWGWYPRAEDSANYDHYLGNKNLAYYYWLLSGITVLTAFWTLIIGCNCNIGVNRDRDEIKYRHRRLMNEDLLPQEWCPSPETIGTRIDIQTRDFVELS